MAGGIAKACELIVTIGRSEDSIQRQDHYREGPTQVKSEKVADYNLGDLATWLCRHLLGHHLRSLDAYHFQIPFGQRYGKSPGSAAELKN